MVAGQCRKMVEKMRPSDFEEFGSTIHEPSGRESHPCKLLTFDKMDRDDDNQGW
jgi:hypothetical protein